MEIMRYTDEGLPADEMQASSCICTRTKAGTPVRSRHAELSSVGGAVMTSTIGQSRSGQGRWREGDHPGPVSAMLTYRLNSNDLEERREDTRCGAVGT